MRVQWCKTHYGTDTNWLRAGWHRQSGPENTSSVELHTEAMNRSSSSEQSQGLMQRYETAHKLRVLQDHKILC
jgi:hypothetical protein